MEQKNYNGEGSIIKKNFSGENQTEVVCEYTLPDYFPDIKRILHVFSDVRKTGMYVSDDKIEYEGCVSCSVLYRGEDKSLQCAEFKAEFSDRIQIKGENDAVCDVVFSPKNMTLRALTPRKVSLKARIETHTDVWEEERITPEIKGVSSEDKIERLTQNIGFSEISVCEETGIGVSEDINVPDNMPTVERVIHTLIHPHQTEVKGAEGKAFVRTELRGAVVYETGDTAGKIAVMPVSISVSHIVQCENMTDDSVCIGKINVYDITSAVTENTNGEKRVIELDFLYDIKILSSTEKFVTAPYDMYAVGCSGFPEYKSIKCDKSPYSLKGNFSVNAQLEKDVCENITGNISLCTGNVENASYSINDGRLVCTGTCDICAVYEGEGYDSVRVSVPFKGEIDIPQKNLNKAVCAVCRCGDVKIRYDGENYFADTEIYVDSVLSEECNYNVIQSIGFENKADGDKRGTFTFYYPTSDEGVWDVAKKYGVPTEVIKSANGISDLISHKNVILIPKKH
ncbi:MAG: DUF3794 domain-containing protein [Clostridia bacterium]|nr:DUF3794 domain-containing protein [Clostridia bacterium]